MVKHACVVHGSHFTTEEVNRHSDCAKEHVEVIVPVAVAADDADIFALLVYHGTPGTILGLLVPYIRYLLLCRQEEQSHQQQ